VFDCFVFGNRETSIPITCAEKRVPRKLPSGFLGTVYNRKVYPVFLDADSGMYRLYIDDLTEDKEKCPIVSLGSVSAHSVSKAHDSTTAPGYEYPNDWYIETNLYGHYIVFSVGGNDSIAEAVARLIEAAGLAVMRMDYSYRPADNGIQYEWFIRLSKTESVEKIKRLAGDIFAGLSKPRSLDRREREEESQAQSSEGYGHDSVLAQIIEGYEGGTLLEIERSALESFEEFRDYLVDEGEWSRPDIASILDPLFYQSASNTLEKAHLIADDLDEQVEDLRLELSQAQQQLNNVKAMYKDSLQRAKGAESISARSEDDLWNEVENLEGQIQVLEEEKKSLHETIDSLQVRLENAKTDSKKLKGRNAGGLRKDMEVHIFRFLEFAFSGFAFDPDTASTISQYYPDPKRLYNLLKVIQEGGSSVRMSPIKGPNKQRWLEVDEHISTGGNGPRGRLYLRKRGDECAWKFDVVVSWKQDDKKQNQLIRQLMTMSPFEQAVVYP
jgi:chaperonin cofactor prefoldin